MSHLSPQEVTAGISRAALETFNRTNGNGSSKPAPIPHTQPTNAVISAARETKVIDTPFRVFSVIEMQSGRVYLRYTEFLENRAAAAVVVIPLDYHETHALSAVLDRLEGEEKPIVEATKGKLATTRIRPL